MLVSGGRNAVEATIPAVYQRSSKTYYLMVNMELEIPDIGPMTITRVSGVDVGRRYLAVETDLQKKSKFYSARKLDTMLIVIKKLEKLFSAKAPVRLLAG